MNPQQGCTSTFIGLGRWSIALLCILCQVFFAEAQQETRYQELRNGSIILKVAVSGADVLRQTLSFDPGLTMQGKAIHPVVINSDGDFGLEIMFTGWQAPGKANNAENPVLFSKADFAPVNSFIRNLPSGAKELTVLMKGKDIPLNVLLTYTLDAKSMYVKRKIAVSDSVFGHHFLRGLIPVRSVIEGITNVIKDGAFGQPVAVLLHQGGGFFGLEYPASWNQLTKEGKDSRVSCAEDVGQLVGKNWVESEWVVEGITPDSSVKRWFLSYLDDIRVAPLRPYTLYNTWYDLRSPEYLGVSPEDAMSETSAKRMIALLRENMIKKHDISLDAFVLDDGWDVYQSDWVLRKEQFPNGLKPLVDELKPMHTTLGVWIGPTGGYSFREQRINWMREHGYEVVGDQMCVAGTKYHELLKARVSDFAGKDGIGYFKWDGIQFSCSELNHGHPIDVYSRRAVLDSLIELCHIARTQNPAMFLNITSGTWLSPWWVKYANTIWMSGQDYGFADVPSISRRDQATTYKDFVLYDDFKTKDLWFPIANLMTHGTIKGRLEYLGTKEEPLDKFTDDALFYVARGISMYELYISPDILTEGEWNALAKSIAWAKDRFPTLMSTDMIGGNPMKRQPYGYVHFKGSRGVIAARNPFIDPAALTVPLSTTEGLDPGAKNLVVERVYPRHSISQRLYHTGESLMITLGGYETAVYEIYPMQEATLPLLAGVVFDEPIVNGSHVELTYYPEPGPSQFLNPRLVKKLTGEGVIRLSGTFALKGAPVSPLATDMNVAAIDERGRAISASFRLSDSVTKTKLEILLTPEAGSAEHPVVHASLDEDTVHVETFEQEGVSRWYSIDVRPGAHHVTISFEINKGIWKGSASLWLVGNQRLESRTIRCELTAPPQQRPMPPPSWPNGEVRKSVPIGKVDVELKAMR